VSFTSGLPGCGDEHQTSTIFVSLHTHTHTPIGCHLLLKDHIPGANHAVASVSTVTCSY